MTFWMSICIIVMLVLFSYQKLYGLFTFPFSGNKLFRYVILNNDKATWFSKMPAPKFFTCLVINNHIFDIAPRSSASFVTLFIVAHILWGRKSMVVEPLSLDNVNTCVHIIFVLYHQVHLDHAHPAPGECSW